MRRSGQIVCRKNRLSCRILTGLAGTLLASLVVLIAMLPDGTSSSSTGSVYGAFLLSPEAGGYVLAAVIAFALGIVVTLLCLRYKKQKQDGKLLKESKSIPSAHGR